MAHGFSVQGGLGAGGSVILMSSSDHSVLVPDTELLFTAQFHRAGPDLVLTGRDGAASFSSRLFLERASSGIGGAERRASFARHRRSARRIADAGTLRAGAADRAARRDRQNRKSRRRRHRGAQRRDGRAPCRRRRVQERRGPDRRERRRAASRFPTAPRSIWSPIRAWRSTIMRTTPTAIRTARCSLWSKAPSPSSPARWRIPAT